MHTDGAVARADGAARRVGRCAFTRCNSSAGQVRSSCSTRGRARCRARLRPLRAPHSTACVRRAARAPRRARHPLRHRLRPLSSSRCARPAARDRLDWRTSIAATRRRLGEDTACRATSIRRWCSPERPALGHRGRARRQRRSPRPHLQPRARCAPRDRPGRPGRSSTSSTSRPRAEAAGARVDGVRHAPARADIEPYYTDIRRGRPPTDEQLADLSRRYEAIGGCRRSAQRTEAQRSRHRSSGALEQYTVALGLKHRPRSRTRSRRSPRTASSGSSGWSSPALLGDVHRRVRRARQAAGRDGAASIAASSRGRPSRRSSSSSPTSSRDSWRRCRGDTKVLFTAHSLPATDRRQRRPVSRRAAGDGHGGRPGGLAWSRADRWADRRAHARAVDDGPTSSSVIDDFGADGTVRAWWCAPAGSSPITSRCSTTSTSRPAGGRSRSASPSSAPAASTTTRVMAALAERAAWLPDDRRRLVVGGGITGCRPPRLALADEGVEVELCEASDRLGGKIRTSPFGGLAHVDEGPMPSCARADRVASRPQGRARPTTSRRPPTPGRLVWSTTGCIRSRAGSCSASRHRCGRSSRPAAVELDAASCAPPPSRSCRARDPTTRSATDPRPLRERGPRPARRRPRRQHLRHRHRPPALPPCPSSPSSPRATAACCSLLGRRRAARRPRTLPGPDLRRPRCRHGRARRPPADSRRSRRRVRTSRLVVTLEADDGGWSRRRRALRRGGAGAPARTRRRC